MATATTTMIKRVHSCHFARLPILFLTSNYISLLLPPFPPLQDILLFLIVFKYLSFLQFHKKLQNYTTLAKRMEIENSV